MDETDDAPGPSTPPGPGTSPRRAALALLSFLLLVPASVTATTDSDGDGLRDAFEVRWGVSDPGNPDSDGDGVVDPAEDGDGDRLGDLGEQRFGTDPAAWDSDGDGRSDGRDDSDGDGRSDAAEQDRRPVPVSLRPSLARAPGDLWTRQEECGGPRWGSTTPKRCWFGDPASAVTMAVVGDSKATMFMPAFIAAARQRGWRVVTLLKGTCSPVLGTTNTQQHVFDGGRSCDRWRRRVIDWLHSARPALIVYVHSDDYGLVDTAGDTITGGRKGQAWERGAAATIAQLPAASGSSGWATCPAMTATRSAAWRPIPTTCPPAPRAGSRPPRARWRLPCDAASPMQEPASRRFTTRSAPTTHVRSSRETRSCGAMMRT